MKQRRAENLVLYDDHFASEFPLPKLARLNTARNGFGHAMRRRGACLSRPSCPRISGPPGAGQEPHSLSTHGSALALGRQVRVVSGPWSAVVSLAVAVAVVMSWFISILPLPSAALPRCHSYPSQINPPTPRPPWPNMAPTALRLLERPHPPYFLSLSLSHSLPLSPSHHHT